MIGDRNVGNNAAVAVPAAGRAWAKKSARAETAAMPPSLPLPLLLATAVPLLALLAPLLWANGETRVAPMVS